MEKGIDSSLLEDRPGAAKGIEGAQKPVVCLLGFHDADLYHLALCLPSLALLCLYPVLEVSLARIPTLQPPTYACLFLHLFHYWPSWNT